MEHIAHLQKDKKLAQIIIDPFIVMDTRKNIPLTLIASIMSQQLSTKVAGVLHKRFLALYGNKTPYNKFGNPFLLESDYLFSTIFYHFNLTILSLLINNNTNHN